MNLQRFNIVFCKHHKDFDEYCYNNCNKTCPSVCNLWYGFIIIPITNLFTAIKYKFVKCNQLSSNCSFRYRNKYCLLNNRDCYSNRNISVNISVNIL